jgi:HEAT repeat protein
VVTLHEHLPLEHAYSAEDARRRLRDVLRSDPVAEVRREAALALGSAGLAAAGNVEALVDAVEDPSFVVRAAAIRALGRHRQPRAVDVLVETLESRGELWQEASAALAATGDVEVVPRIVPLLRSPRTQARRGALRALAALAAGDASASVDPLLGYTDEAGVRHALF